MKRKTLFILLALLGASSVQAATPVTFISNTKGNIKCKFAYGLVNGTTYFAQTDYDQTIAALTVFSGTAPFTSSTFTPTAFEVNLTTCVLNGFEAPDNFYAAQTYKGILPYLDELEIRIQSMNRVAGHAGQRADIQQRLDFLSSAAKTLP